MTSPRRRIEKIGRTEHRLNLPYPTVLTPDQQVGNWREVQRWADQLPMPHYQTMVPYWVSYAPEESDVEWDVDFKDIFAEYGDDKIPGGMWLCGMTAQAVDVSEHPNWGDRTGIRVVAQVNAGTGEDPDVRTVGVTGDSGGVETVTDIDFTLETFETEWRVPGFDVVTQAPIARSLSIFKVDDLSTVTVRLQAYAELYYFVDPTVDGSLAFDNVDCQIYAWAYRLTDYYGIPREREDITPD